MPPNERITSAPPTKHGSKPTRRHINGAPDTCRVNLTNNNVSFDKIPTEHCWPVNNRCQPQQTYTVGTIVWYLSGCSCMPSKLGSIKTRHPCPPVGSTRPTTTEGLKDKGRMQQALSHMPLISRCFGILLRTTCQCQPFPTLVGIFCTGVDRRVASVTPKP